MDKKRERERRKKKRPPLCWRDVSRCNQSAWLDLDSLSLSLSLSIYLSIYPSRVFIGRPVGRLVRDGETQ